MAKIKTSAFINAPVEKVFAYWQDPNNRPEVWPSLLEIKDVQDLPGGGHKWSWVYKMAGIRLKGESQDIEYIPNQRIVDQSTGGVTSQFVYTFQPENEGTRLTFEIEYTVPVPVLGNLAESFIIKMNEQEAESILANLQARLES